MDLVKPAECLDYDIALWCIGFNITAIGSIMLQNFKYKKEYIAVCLYFVLVDLVQYTGWIYCTMPSGYSAIADTAIWIQPYLFAHIGWRTSSDKQFYKYFTWIAIMVFFVTSIVRINGSYSDDVGMIGFAVWEFEPIVSGWYPNYWVCIGLCTISFAMYDKLATLIIPYIWLVTLISSWTAMSVSLSEMATSWCFFGTMANTTLAGCLVISVIISKCITHADSGLYDQLA